MGMILLMQFTPGGIIHWICIHLAWKAEGPPKPAFTVGVAKHVWRNHRASLPIWPWLAGSVTTPSFETPSFGMKSLSAQSFANCF